MKKYSYKEIIIATIVLVAIPGLVIWYMKSTPPKTDYRCTTEYVNEHGDGDCEESRREDDAEYDAYLERQMY